MASESTRIFKIVKSTIAPARPALTSARGALISTFARLMPSHATSAIASRRFRTPMPDAPLDEAHPLAPGRSTPRSIQTRCHGRKTSMMYRMPAPNRILWAVDIFDMSNPPDCDMHAPFLAPPRRSRLPEPGLSNTEPSTESNAYGRFVSGAPCAQDRRPARHRAGDDCEPWSEPGPREGRWEQHRQQGGDHHQRTETHDRHVPSWIPQPGAELRGGDDEAADRGERGDQGPVAAPCPGPERARAWSEPTPRERRRENGDAEPRERERPGAAGGARCPHGGRLAGVGAQDVGEALAAEVLAAHRRRAREAHRTAAPVATSDRRVSRMSVASIEDLRRAFVRCHDRRVPRPLRRSRLTARRTVPRGGGGAGPVAVLASGAGTNLQALLDDAVVGPWVVLAISDRASAVALDRARARSVGGGPLDPA